MRDSTIIQLSVSVYAGLLNLYPEAFRDQYGREMLLVFRQQCLEARQQSSSWSIAQIWMRTLYDFVRNAPTEHYSMVRGELIMFRRGCDLAVSLLMLWIGLPILLPIALLIKLDTPGPVFYVSQRVGHNGHVFRLYKLRSMTHEPAGRRVTVIGAVLRWTRLDEYPQFYNVLRGDMCLFGPRPLMPERAETFQLAVKPGFVPWFSR